MIYSGFTLKELSSSTDPNVTDLLGQTDILVDGPFDHRRHADLVWRGSTNQRVHLLTPQYAHLAGHLSGPGVGVELHVDASTHLFWAGVPAPGVSGRLRAAARTAGLTLEGTEEVWS